MSDRDHYGESYFAERVGEIAQLPLRQKPCKDCAVTTGFYRPMANDLKRCRFQVRVAYSGEWWCHNDRRVACRGNAAIQGPDVLRMLKRRDCEAR